MYKFCWHKHPHTHTTHTNRVMTGLVWKIELTSQKTMPTKAQRNASYAANKIICFICDFAWITHNLLNICKFYPFFFWLWINKILLPVHVLGNNTLFCYQFSVGIILCAFVILCQSIPNPTDECLIYIFSSD